MSRDCDGGFEGMGRGCGGVTGEMGGGRDGVVSEMSGSFDKNGGRLNNIEGRKGENVMKKGILGVVMAVMMMFGGVLTGNVALAESGVCETGPEMGVWKEDISGCKDPNKGVDRLVKNGINFLIGIVMFLAIVFIIWAGFTYVTSAGDAGKIKVARTTLIYSVVGLVVAMLAFTIVNFVLKALFEPGS